MINRLLFTIHNFLWDFDLIQNALNDVGAGNLFGFGFVTNHNTMAQHIGCNLFDIFRGDK